MALILNKGRYFAKGQSIVLSAGLIVTKTSYDANKEIPTHLHQDSYLAVVTEGGYRETGEGFDDTLKPGTTIFHPGKEAHKNYFGLDGAKLINLEMPHAFWTAKELSDLKPKARIISHDPRYLEYATKISDELANPRRLSLIGVEGLALQILDVFLKLNNQPDEAPILLGKIDAYIHAQYADSLTLDQTAKKYEVSPDWLSRKFYLFYGESLNDRITRIRVNAATQLLTATPLILSEIAVKVGFFDQSHFTRTFKKVRGVSPGQYRRMAQSK